MRDNYALWSQVFMEMAYTIAKRSKDSSTQCGAVLVDERNVVISSGFNGPPPQIDDTKVPWNDRPQKYAFILHAEENAIDFGLERRGLVKGSTIYCTHSPCSECVLKAIRHGVKEIVIPSCHTPYPLSKYQIDPQEVIDAQRFPKLVISQFDFIKPEEK